MLLLRQPSAGRFARAILLLSLLPSVSGAQVVIGSFSGNGILQWTGPTNTSNILGYNIEWAPSLDGPWYTNWPAVGIPPTGTVFSAQVPMFYRVVAIPRLPGDTAETAPLVTVGTYTGTTVGYASDYGAGTSCVGTGGPDRVYQIVVPAGQRLSVVATPEAGYDLTLNLMASLGVPRVCVAGADSYLYGMPETLVYNNTSGADLLMYVVVGGGSTSQAGSYSIAFALEATPSGDVLGNAVAVSAGSISGTTVGYTDDYGSGTRCVGTAGPDRVYVILVPAGKRLTAVVSPAASYNAALNLMLGGGTPRTCVGGADAGGAGVAETAVYSNGSATTVPVYVVVESSLARTQGTFMLDLALTDLLPGEIVENATPITAGSYGDTTVGYANDYGAGTSCAGTAGPDRVYQITVPAGKRLMVTVTPAAGYNVSVNLVAGNTSPRVCLAGADSGGSGVSETVSCGNGSASDVPVYVVVGSATASAAGSYVLNASFVDFLPGDVLENAPLVGPGTYADTLSGYYNDYGSGTGCAYNTGPDRAYQIIVPAGQRLNAVVTPSLGWDAVINLMLGATVPRVCVAGADAGSYGATETLIYTNTSASAVPVYVMVEGYSQTIGDGLYTLQLELGVPPGETCANAQVVTADTLTNLTTAGYLNDYTPSGCLSSQAGRDRVFSVDVPAGQLLTASVIPTGTGNPSIYLAAVCGSSPLTCLAGDDSGTTTATNTVSYRNPGTNSQTYYIVVDSSSSSTPVSSFSLSVRLSP